MRGKPKWQMPNHVARLKIIRKKKDSTKKQNPSNLRLSFT